MAMNPTMGDHAHRSQAVRSSLYVSGEVRPSEPRRGPRHAAPDGTTDGETQWTDGETQWQEEAPSRRREPGHQSQVIPRRLSAALQREPAMPRDDFYRLMHLDSGALL